MKIKWGEIKNLKLYQKTWEIKVQGGQKWSFVKAGSPDHSLSSACRTDSSTVTHKETVICRTPWRTALITELIHNSECKELIGISGLASERAYLGKKSKGRKIVNVSIGGIVYVSLLASIYLHNLWDILHLQVSLGDLHNNMPALCL